jgi:hypothetical protein
MDHSSSLLNDLQAATGSIVSVFHDALKNEMLYTASSLAGIEVVDCFTSGSSPHHSVMLTWNDRVLDLDDYFPTEVTGPAEQAAFVQASFVAETIFKLERVQDMLRAVGHHPKDLPAFLRV